MDKILVEIYLPASGRNYDVYIPLKNKLYETLALLATTISELSEGYFSGTNETVICNKLTGVVLDINMSAEELGLYNGSKLMLI
jgi:hypothetical protein